MYSVEFSKKAEEQLSKLPEDLNLRIIHVLERIRIRPHHFVKRIIGTDYFRLRIGDYRAILDIKNNQLIIFVLEIGHRKNIYE
ncbi:MAG: type II toxin-antitoxin system RelE/ParE family toxin [Nanoarchaeota archaeon]